MTEVPIPSAGPVVEVRGEATLRGMPDLATLTVTIRADGRRPDEVTDLLARRSARLRTELDRFSGAIESTASTGLQVGPTFERGSVLRPRGYQGSVTSTVVVHDFAQLGALVVALGEVEQSAVTGPAWSLRRENPMYRSARLAAVEDARQRADDYADAFGSLVVGLLGVSDLEPAPPVWRAQAAFARGLPDDQPPLELEPEEQEVTGRVTVRFRISDPDLGAVLPADNPTTVEDLFPGPISPVSPLRPGDGDPPPDDGVPAR